VLSITAWLSCTYVADAKTRLGVMFWKLDDLCLGGTRGIWGRGISRGAPLCLPLLPCRGQCSLPIAFYCMLNTSHLYCSVSYPTKLCISYFRFERIRLNSIKLVHTDISRVKLWFKQDKSVSFHKKVRLKQRNRKETILFQF